MNQPTDEEDDDMAKNGRQEQTLEEAALKAVEQAVSEQMDPAPDPNAVPRERVTTLVHHISLETMSELRALRDDIDDLMRTIAAKEKTVCQDVVGFSDVNDQAMECKQIAAEAFQKLRERFLNSPNAIPGTIDNQHVLTGGPSQQRRN